MVNCFEKVMLAPCDAREKLSDSRGFDTDRMVPGPVMILMSSQGLKKPLWDWRKTMTQPMGLEE